MYLIIGLGNPESDYSGTRHNMGFNVINELAKQYNINISRKKFESEFGDGIIEGQKVILIKPQTFMNNSGESLIQWVNFYKPELENIIVVYDDTDIEPGKIRIRKSGSSGSHNGMKSIVHCLNTEKFPRIRVGIGKPEGFVDMIQYVIGPISDEDKEVLAEGTKKAKDAIVELMKNGIDSSMNKFN